MATGIDFAFNPHPSVAVEKANGVTFVCRYISPNTANDTNGKNLIPSEKTAILAAGLSIVMVFESVSGRMKSGQAAGAADAAEADTVVKALGMAGMPVYFACDFDATPTDQTAINAYLDGAASVIGRNRVGIYGGYYPVKRALDAGKAHYAWQTYAWSGGQWDARAQLRQVQNGVTMGGASVDKDVSQTVDFGQYPRPITPTPAPAPPPAPSVFHGEYVTGGMFDLDNLAVKLGYPVHQILSMTLKHYGSFDPILAKYLDDVFAGPTPASNPVPKGAKLYCD